MSGAVFLCCLILTQVSGRFAAGPAILAARRVAESPGRVAGCGSDSAAAAGPRYFTSPR